ncbi:MAG: LacI family DNA-binding transcriptional regulator [Verrucomicrobiae bacterium]|nr:LacI family DNA-binding transcriptional regulator [Verrucomicrobiae bacterium]
MVRLKEIAAAAGVSVMTVSKALRDKPDLSAATKARIQGLAAQMGYVPDISAQGLRNQKSRILGLVMSAATNPVNARILLGLGEGAHELGYDLVVTQTLNRPDREEAVLRRLIARRADGIFLSPVYRMEPAAPIYEELLRRRIPVVLLGHRAPFCEAFPAIETDDLEASVAVTRHLLDLGHRRIAFFSGPRVSPASLERLEGYRRAHRETGVPLDDQLVFNAGATIEEGASAALQWLQEGSGATAIQCAHDLVAIGAADTLLNQGFRIPGDVSVVGFGNVLAAEYFRVPLTTVRQPKLRLGAVAMDTMLRMLRGEAVSSQRLPAQLEIRASTAPPGGTRAVPTPVPDV